MHDLVYVTILNRYYWIKVRVIIAQINSFTLVSYTHLHTNSWGRFGFDVRLLICTVYKYFCVTVILFRITAYFGEYSVNNFQTIRISCSRYALNLCNISIDGWTATSFSWIIIYPLSVGVHSCQYGAVILEIYYTKVADRSGGPSVTWSLVKIIRGYKLVK